MILSRIFGLRISRALLVPALVVSVVLGAVMAWTQSVPPGPGPQSKLSEAERARRIAERDRYEQEANRLGEAGNLGEAIHLLGKELAIEREVLGELHEDVVDSLNFLARLHEAGEDWAAARRSLTEVIVIRQRQPDRKDWRIGDARRALADLDRRAALNPAQRQRLQELDRLNGLQGALQRQGKYAEGIDSCRRAIEIRSDLLGSDHPDNGRSLCDLAWLYRDKGDYARAEPMLREALAIRKKALGADHPNYASSLGSLASLYREMNDYARAEPMLREALAITKKALGVDHPNYASSLNNLALLYQAMGDYARAEPMLREALAIRKKVSGADHLFYAHSLNNLACLYRDMSDYARAEPMYREALAIYKKAMGADHPEYATALDNLASLYRDKGDYDRAEPMYREALAIRKKASGEDHPHYALSLGNLANMYLAKGDYARAEPMYREALAIRKKAMGADHPGYALSLGSLASLYGAMSDYTRAVPMLREALAIYKRAMGADHPHYAGFLNSLAALYFAMGDHARAEPMLIEALTIYKRAMGADHPRYALSLNNLAALYLAKGEHARAEPMLREAVAIYEKAMGPDHPSYANSLCDLAWLYRDKGDYARAEPMLREAVATYKKAMGADHPDYAMGLNKLAALYLNMGDHARAEPMYCEAVAIFKKALGADHPYYANSLNNLAWLYLVKSDYVRAVPMFGEALKITSNLTRGTSAILGERQRLRLYQDQRHAMDYYLSVSRSTGAKPTDLYRQVLYWKGTAEARQGEDRLAHHQPELAPSLAQLGQVRRQLANMAFRQPHAGMGETWRQQLDSLREVKEDLEADLARWNADYRGMMQAEQLGPDEVAAALPAEVVLVDFLEYDHFSPPQGGKGRPQSERRMMAFVVRRGRPVALVPLGAAQAIDESVQTWRRALDARQGGALQTAAAELGRRVWEPLRPHLGDARTVLIAPDGDLAFLPFAALPGSRPGSYLIEDLAIGYVASGRSAIEALTAPQGPAGHGLLAIGDVDFQADPGQPGPAARPPLGFSVASKRDGFGPLPGTGPEASRARELFHAAFAGQPADLMTRAEPTEAAIKRRLDGGRWRVVHLGTHGFFESPARIAALRAAVRREDPPALARMDARPGEDINDFALTPLLRSGVVLAGGGRDPGAGVSDSSADAPPREDGILTAEEVQALDLRGTELVVLSACETGLGTLEHGQGVMGLQRAFHSAGARAVVASLWRVDDTATTVLMEQFYTNLWDKKLPKLEALRQAQIAVLKDPGLVTKRRAELAKERGIGEKPDKLADGGRIPPPDARATRSDPALWAAFVLSGDGR